MCVLTRSRIGCFGGLLGVQFKDKAAADAALVADTLGELKVSLAVEKSTLSELEVMSLSSHALYPHP